MATKRMFSQIVVMSDDFLDMPASTRCLYFSLGMVADDDGFVNNPRSIMRQCGASQDDMLLLLQKGYVYIFDTGIIVVLHWRINNRLRPDRYTPTKHTVEKAQLSILDNSAYAVLGGIPDGIPSGTPLVSPDKNSLDKTSIETSSSEASDDVSPKKGKGKTFPQDSNAYKAAALLARLILERNPELKPRTERDLQRWANDIDKINRLDGYEWEMISDVLTFSQRDPFWQTHTLSGAKLRKQFETLYAQMKRGGSNYA